MAWVLKVFNQKNIQVFFETESQFLAFDLSQEFSKNWSGLSALQRQQLNQNLFKVML